MKTITITTNCDSSGYHTNTVQGCRGCCTASPEAAALDTADVYCADSGQYLGQCRHSDYDLLRMTDVVLTIAHLDHVPENCAPENLRAWCQRCHLRYDAEHHKQTAYRTRKNAALTIDMWADHAA